MVIYPVESRDDSGIVVQVAMHIAYGVRDI